MTSRLPDFPTRASGFTIIEVIVVIAIIGFLSAIALPFLSTAIATNDLQIAGEEAVDALREAQSSSMSGRNAGRFGVHFETSQFVFFEGATYTVGAPTNVAHPLTGNVTASAITISGGGSDVHFASHKGEPAETGTIVFSDQSGDTRTVSINAVGMVEVQ